MELRLVHELPPAENNPRNSEGSFLRGKGGELLFAYSRYTGDNWADECPCDIALIRSFDEGETWSEPEIIAHASLFGVQNIMSVSGVIQQNGDLGFYFCIKEKDLTMTLGRAISSDGVHFTAERVICDFPPAYYIVNNDRIIRLPDGRLVAPAAYIQRLVYPHEPFITTLLVSEDDGKSFTRTSMHFAPTAPVHAPGYQEPGIAYYGGRLHLWMRTNAGCQYESISTGGLEAFPEPYPSKFTSPLSPMHIKVIGDTAYAIYNPIPSYNGRVEGAGTMGRTPYVLRRTQPGGLEFGELEVLEEDPERGYCYPAVFETHDGKLLLAYCRGHISDGWCLCRLGIAKLTV